MSLFKNEEALARYWKMRLEERYLKVFKNINIASRKFNEHWMNWWGISMPPAQPNIDLLIVDKSLRLFAIELKYFRKSKSKRRVNQSFYEGIDESLALLRFGFESVNLWHCFDRNLPKMLIGQYHTTTLKLINSLRLPIEYQGLYLDEHQGEVHAYPLINGKVGILKVKKTGQRAIPIIPIMGLLLNPLRDESDAKKTIDFLRMVLRIPSV